MNNPTPVTRGAHHVGLTVSRLEDSAAFFTHTLGWNLVRRDTDYPAIFVTDGVLMITLWQAKSDDIQAFDRKQNVGLHHLALAVASAGDLAAIHTRIEEHGHSIEFAPELLRDGPARHMMCYDPSGIRVEFIWVPG